MVSYKMLGVIWCNRGSLKSVQKIKANIPTKQKTRRSGFHFSLLQDFYKNI